MASTLSISRASEEGKKATAALMDEARRGPGENERDRGVQEEEDKETPLIVVSLSPRRPIFACLPD